MELSLLMPTIWLAGQEKAGGRASQLCNQGGGQGWHQDGEDHPRCVMRVMGGMQPRGV